MAEMNENIENFAEAATKEEQQNLIAMILENLRNLKQKLAEAIANIKGLTPARRETLRQSINNHISKTEKAVKDLEGKDGISRDILKGMYDISTTFEAALDLGDLKAIVEALNKVDSMAREAKESSEKIIYKQMKNFEDSVKDAFATAGIDVGNDIFQKAVMLTGKDGNVYMAVPNNDNPNRTTYEPVIEISYKNNNPKENVIYTPKKDCVIENYKNGELVLRDRNDDTKQYDILTKEDSVVGIATMGEKKLDPVQLLKANIQNALAAKHGEQVYNDALKEQSVFVKKLTPYIDNIVKDNSGREATFNKHDNTFRIYDPETKDLLVFSSMNGTVEGRLYTNMNSVDMPLYVKKSLELDKIEYDLSQPLFTSIPVMESNTKILRTAESKQNYAAMGYKNESDMPPYQKGVNDNEFFRVCETNIKIPAGNASVYYMLQGASMKDFMQSQGYSDFNIQQTQNIKNMDGILIDKSSAVTNRAALDNMAILWSKYANVAVKDFEINDAFNQPKNHFLELSAKTSNTRGGSTITLETSEGGQFRMSLNQSGTAVQLQYKEQGAENFLPVYDPMRNTPIISAENFNYLKAKDPSFSPILTAAAKASRENYFGVEHQQKEFVQHQKESTRETAKNDRGFDR